MKIDLISIAGTKIKETDLPSQFDEELRPDLIKKAVLALQSKRKSYGADPMAGKKTSAELSRRRRNYRGSYGLGISRVPRKILSRRGTRMNWVGAFAPGTVGGRRAHAPKAEKKWEHDINKKERRKAIRSALSATLNKEIVEERGHLIPKQYPFIIEDKFEKIQKTKDALGILKTIDLEKELKRVSKKNIRAGKGKGRGRRYKTVRGILIVISQECKLQKALDNIPGLDVQIVNSLNTDTLAPGAVPGRLTIYTQNALKKIQEEKLFI